MFTGDSDVADYNLAALLGPGKVPDAAERICFVDLGIVTVNAVDEAERQRFLVTLCELLLRGGRNIIDEVAGGAEQFLCGRPVFHGDCPYTLHYPLSLAFSSNLRYLASKMKSRYVQEMNLGVFRWARESAGLSPQDVAVKMKRSVDDIISWETGRTAPTYPQLEKLAYDVFKRPIALFFFDAPPEESSAQDSFRTLPEFLLKDLSADTRYAIRQGQAYQASLRELHFGENPSEAPVFRAVKANLAGDPVELAKTTRTLLGISLTEQFKWTAIDEAFRSWRYALELAGVYVFKRSFKQREVVGFCLLDHDFPVILVNNYHAQARQIFTMLHELAHVLLGVNTVTLEGIDDSPESGEAYRAVERYCDRFTSALLVPNEQLLKDLRENGPVLDQIPHLAQRYSVSREVIARRFLDLQWITKADYLELSKSYNREFQESKTSKSKTKGPSYYRTQASYLGDPFLNTVFSAYHQGRVTLDQVALHLGITPKNVQGFEDIWLRKIGSSR